MVAAPRDQPSLEAATRARQEQLFPVYHSIAVHFAQMHDTPVSLRTRNVVMDLCHCRTELMQLVP